MKQHVGHLVGQQLRFGFRVKQTTKAPPGWWTACLLAVSVGSATPWVAARQQGGNPAAPPEGVPGPPAKPDKPDDSDKPERTAPDQEVEAFTKPGGLVATEDLEQRANAAGMRVRVRGFRVEGLEAWRTAGAAPRGGRIEIDPNQLFASFAVFNGALIPGVRSLPGRPLAQPDPVLPLTEWLQQVSAPPGEGGGWFVTPGALDSLVQPAFPSSREEYETLRIAFRERPLAVWLLDRLGIDLGEQEFVPPDGDDFVEAEAPNGAERQNEQAASDQGEPDDQPTNPKGRSPAPAWRVDDRGWVVFRVPPPGPGVFDDPERPNGVGLSVDDIDSAVQMRAPARFEKAELIPFVATDEELAAGARPDPFADPVFKGVMSLSEAMGEVRAELFRYEVPQGEGAAPRVVYIAAREGMPRGRVRGVTLNQVAQADGEIAASALDAFCLAIARRMVDKGIAGTIVTRLHADDKTLFPDDGDRPGVLRLRVHVPRVGQTRMLVRSLDDETPRIDPPDETVLTRRIRAGSPVTEDGLIRARALDDYTLKLNRNPSRRVDVTLTAQEDQRAGVDYLVTTARPWTLYAQLSNTGTSSTTELRERFGVSNYNLSGVDDALLIDYVTGNFQEVHAVYASYERPFSFNPDLKWRAFGSFSKYDASEVGLGGLEFTGETAGGGLEMSLNFFQRRSFFADAVGGARFEHVSVENNAGIDTDNQFFLPYFGLRCESRGEAAEVSAALFAEFNAPDIAGTNSDEIDELGRFDSDDSWEILRGEVSASVFLESLLVPTLLAQGRTTLAHELLVSARGFTSLGDRLPPNYAETAGGLYSVRGYDEAFVVGDEVVTGTVEYRFHLPRALTSYAQLEEAPGTLFGQPFNWRPPRPLLRPDWDLVFKGFFDIGRVGNADRQPFEQDTTLASAGIGAELVMGRGFTARVDWGIVLLDNDNESAKANEGDSKVHFVITLLF